VGFRRKRNTGPKTEAQENQTPMARLVAEAFRSGPRVTYSCWKNPFGTREVVPKTVQPISLVRNPIEKAESFTIQSIREAPPARFPRDRRRKRVKSSAWSRSKPEERKGEEHGQQEVRAVNRTTVEDNHVQNVRKRPVLRLKTKTLDKSKRAPFRTTRQEIPFGGERQTERREKCPNVPQPTKKR